MPFLKRLFRRGELERDLDRELKSHIEEEGERLRAAGMSPEEAHRRALAAFGGLEPMKERARDVRGTRWIEDLAADLRQGLRMMRRSPGFTLVAVLSLAIGIGANAAIFAVADALLLRTLPVERPDELVYVTRAGLDQQNVRFSYPMLERFKAAVPEAGFAGMSATTRVQARVNGSLELVGGQIVSGDWFQVTGVAAAAGRLMTPADASTLGREPVVVLSHRYWMRRFAGDAAVVGSTLEINGQMLTVIGVTAEHFNGHTVGEVVSVWMPATMQHEVRYNSNASLNDADGRKPWLPQDGVEWLTIIARVPASMDRTAFHARVQAERRLAIERGLAKVTDEEAKAFQRREHIELLPGAFGLSFLRETFSSALQVLAVTMAVVLLIGCANLASLLLARGAARSREFALRLSLGARRNRLVRQLLTETMLLAVAGGLAGVVVARWGSQALLRLASSVRQSAIPLDLIVDWRLPAFILGVSVVTGLAFGLMPALRLSRGNVSEVMKAGSRVAGGAERLGVIPFGKVLVVAQVALSLALLADALLFLKTFSNLLSVDTGYERAHVITARFDPRISGFEAPQLPALYARLTEQAQRVPGVQSASVALYGAVTGAYRTSTIVVEGHPVKLGQDDVREEYVDPEYFKTLGITLLRGRAFRPQDDARVPLVAVVNTAMVKRFFGDDDPVGKRFGYDTKPDTEIIGIVADARVDGLRSVAPAMLYRALAQAPDEFARTLFVRVTGSVDIATAALERAVKNAEPNLALREVVTVDELAERTVSRERMVSRLTGLFGLIAVAVACLGLYGTVSYSVARRTNEIGIRLALGADPSRVRRQVLGETMRLVAAGCVAGLALALLTMGFAASLLYGLSPRDPATLAVAAAVLVAIGALAGAIPAWRASRVDPMRALRAE